MLRAASRIATLPARAALASAAAPAASTTSGVAQQRRGMYGIGEKNQYVKLPGRKALDDVCKLSLLEAAPPEQIINIWNDNHMQFVQYYGRVISAAAYTAMRPRLEQSPYFVVPVFRDKGLFNVVTNFNDDLVGVVPLGEWQQKGDSAIPHMTVQFFTELARSKDLVLVRCEISDKVFTKQDCTFVVQMLLKYYTMPNLYSTYVETFNKKPHNFDFHAFLRHMKDEAGKDNIKIEDRKTEMRGGAYNTSTAGLTLPRGKAASAGVELPKPHVAEAIRRAGDKKSSS